MPVMTKRVNITTRIPIRTVTPTLHGTYKGIIMSTGDILKCISKRAVVDEVLPNGTTVRLTMRNYYTDNGAGLDAAKIEVKIEDTSAVTDTINNTVIDNVDEVLEAPEAPVEAIDEAPVVETTLEPDDEAETGVKSDDATVEEDTNSIEQSTAPKNTSSNTKKNRKKNSNKSK